MKGRVRHSPIFNVKYSIIDFKMKEKPIKIKTNLGAEFDSEVVAGSEKYLVQTELEGARKPHFITRIYLKGKILLTRKTDFSDLIDTKDMEKRVRELMQKQHQLIVSMLKAGKFKETKTTSDYLGEVKELLRVKNKRKALRVLDDALEHYPDDPFLLSYYGCLDAIANKNYKDGIETCLTAIGNLKEKVAFGEEFFYPVFYLNLGRAYLAAGKKKEAIDAFNKGIKMDAENKDLLWEIRKLGIRRTPPVPFLKRSNPINKYIGRMLHSMNK